jgi:phage-related protein
MKSIGSGVSELRIRDESGAFRVIYIAKFEEAVYVLHCFEKKSERTARADIELAAARYKEVRARRHGI